MIRYVIISLLSGLLFAVLDGLIHANPVAQKLMLCFKPIAKSTINVPAGITIDLFYGFVMCGLFLLLYDSLFFDEPALKGVLYGLIIWFFRVVMSVLSMYMTQKVPGITLAYILLTGLLEMVIIGVFYGLTIRPSSV
jgi:hypothetical protein